ncbi:Lrp/AsnC family transcriptional regulator [Puia sp. P3]|uniref:Lrp/AsnC family transcriptional regulator n=1 Tax=Puia sp. P3 TaxID=3423952 RepID=UPI003D67B2E4
MKKEQTPSPAFDLDAADIRILNLLRKDGRLSVRELAKEVNLSPTPVHERPRRLEAAGVTDHYAAVVNPGRIGHLIVFFRIPLPDRRKSDPSAIPRNPRLSAGLPK